MADAADIVIRVRTDGVGSADAALRRLQATGVKVETVSERMEAGFRRTSKSATALHQTVSSLYAVMTVGTILSYVGVLTKLSDSWKDVTNQLANANSANERIAVIQQRVFDIAQRTRTSLESTATLYARMERSLNQYGVTGTQVAQVTETINKAMIVSGATVQESTAAIIQFSQGLQSGVLRGDEFRSVMEQAPRLGKMIADGLGVGTKGLRQMANQGMLTADVVINAISKAAGTIDEEFGRTMPTFAQQWQIADNKIKQFVGTSQQVQSVVNLAGAGVKYLSDNLETLATVVTGVVAILGGRMLTALYTQMAAYVKLNASIASSSAIHIRSIDAITRSSVARYEEAKATLAQAQAERVAIQAAMAAEQQYYKGIATLNAYMQNTGKVRAATEALSAAQTTMTARMEVATVASRVLTVGLTGLRTVMGLLGGPLGIIMLAATGWMMYSENQKVANQQSLDLAQSTDDLKNKLETLTLAQQRALLVENQRAQINVQEQINEQSSALAKLTTQYNVAQTVIDSSISSDYAKSKALQDQRKIMEDRAVIEGDISGKTQKLNDLKNNQVTIENNLTAAVMGTTGAIQAQTEALNINIGAANARSQAVETALQSEQAKVDSLTMKLGGNARQAAQLDAVQQRLGKTYASNKAFIDNYISGHYDATAVLTNEQKGIIEFINLSGKAYDKTQQWNKKLKEQREALKNDKAIVTYADVWQKSYERVEALGQTGVERLRIQQESEVRIIKEKAKKAQATEEELQNAIIAIDEKYSRLRQQVAEKYKPGVQMVREYREAQQEIKELQQGGLLNDEQANNARLQLDADYYKKRADMRSLDAMGSSQDQMQSELDALQEQYNNAIAIAQGNEEQLTQIKEEYEKRRFDIQMKYAQQQAQAQQSTTLSYINSVGSMANSMVTILEAAGEKGSGAYKTMFALSKAFSIAQATLNLTTAISQVLADPASLSPAQKFANMAAVAAAGASLISQISSASLGGMAHDGIDNIPKEGTWLLDKGERVLNAPSNAKLNKFLDSQGGSYSGGSAGPVTIHQHIVVNGQGDAALQQALQQAARDGAQQGYNQVLNDIASNGDIRRQMGI